MDISGIPDSASVGDGRGFATPHVLITDTLSGNARWYADKVAVVCGNRRLTWREFNARANRVANALLEVGVAKGDKIAVLMPNGIETAEAMCGILKAGGVVVPLSTLLPGPGLVRQIADSNAKVLFVGAPLNENIAPHLAELNGVIDQGFVSIGFHGDGFQPYEALLAPVADSEPGVQLSYGDDFNIMYSSGTTGVPKGVVHTHFARQQFALGLALGCRVNFGTTGIITTPMYSNGTWIVWLPTIMAGGTVIIMPHFDPRAFLELVERERATYTFMVPTQYLRTLAVPDFDDFDISSLEVVVSAGSPLMKETKDQILRRFGCKLAELYGLTEGIATILQPEVVREKIGSVGVPWMGWDIRIIDNSGHELQRGQIGEIVGRSTFLMRGYHRRPDMTREVTWTDELGRSYLRTGDIGRLDDDGYLYLLDRKKDMIISGGQNVYPIDIESVLLAHSEVSEAAVIGIPHEKWGETPLALVVLRPEATIQSDELRQWVNAQLASYQRVAALEFREMLPRNQLGKLLKRELREPYWTSK